GSSLLTRSTRITTRSGDSTKSYAPMPADQRHHGPTLRRVGTITCAVSSGPFRRQPRCDEDSRPRALSFRFGPVLFLEGRQQKSDKPSIPQVSDGVVYRVLSNLLILDVSA